MKSKYTIDLDSKRLVKNTSARGIRYKVFCNGQFYGWLKRKHYNELKKYEKMESNYGYGSDNRNIFDEYGNAI